MKTFLPITRDQVLKMFQPINPKTHKGIQGHALLIGGSYGKIGSLILSSKAALKTGCGLVTSYIPKCGYTILQTAVPEIMVLTDNEEKIISKIEYAIHPQAIGIGPGMGTDSQTQKALHEFLKTNQIPLVVDADAINCIAIQNSLFKLLQPKTILTPHVKELERLIGTWNSVEEMLQKTMNLSLQYNLIIVLKGAPTLIVDGKIIYENTTGNAALATAGSGDVLTGMITSLLAQSYNAIDAAILGVYLHGLCADLKDSNTSTQSFIASDIIENLGNSFLNLGI